MTELKPCPFCGSPVQLSISIYGLHGVPDHYAIFHPDDTECLINGVETSSYLNKEELIEDWNRRLKE